MFLKKLSLFNFRNHSEKEFSFIEDVNSFSGNNGTGKTNVLDAIHYLSLCKSYFTASDSLSIQEGLTFFALHGIFDINGNEENIYCGLKQGQRKIVKRNNKEYQRLADHIGLIPVVMIAPVDQELTTGSSEERRKSVDSVICQCNRQYLDDLTAYNRILMQRNALLKSMAQSGRFDENALLIWDDQLADYGSRIFAVRNEFILAIKDIFAGVYMSITGGGENASVRYVSQLESASLHELLQQHQHRDRLLQYTTAGIHKDDLEFLINGRSVKRFGSQGQQKSYVAAYKLALYQYIKMTGSVKPLLLLDDIFEKLDDNRMNNLLQHVGTRDYGQLFITDTHAGRVKSVFRNFGKSVKEFHFSL